MDPFGSLLFLEHRDELFFTFSGFFLCFYLFPAMRNKEKVSLGACDGVRENTEAATCIADNSTG